MNVDVVQNDVSSRFIAVGRNFNDQQSSTVVDGNVVFWICLIVGLVTVPAILACLCRCQQRRRKLRRKQQYASNSTVTSTSAVYSIPIDPEVTLRTPQDVTRRYERSVSSISTKSQIYLVPFSVLPADFDYASREVEVRADYVILKDLSMLTRYDNNTSSNHNNGGYVNEAYLQQEAFNPYLHTPIPPLGEAYKKQAPYNPTFY